MKRVAIVSPKEIAKDQGKPLSKYERNMMIFDWLHTLGKMKSLTIKGCVRLSVCKSVTSFHHF